MFIALSSSTILGLLMALLREQSDNGFRTTGQLSALTGLPVFGELPTVSNGLLIGVGGTAPWHPDPIPCSRKP